MSVRAAWVLFVLALVAIAVLAWFARAVDAPLPNAGDAVGASTEPSADATTSTIVTATSSTRVTNAAASPADERTPAVPSPRESSPRTATIRGRCVDESGAPVAECTVTVHGARASERRVEAWLLDHAELPDWHDVAATTGTDGRFEVAFWPPPPLQFTLDVRYVESVPMTSRILSIAAGAAIDVGDVPLARGVRLQGRVVDARNDPVANVQLHAVSTSAQRAVGSATPAPLDSRSVTSDADGRFRCADLLPAGPFRVTVSGDRRLVSPCTGTLDPTRSVEDVLVVVGPPNADGTIRGKVVDAAGQPVAEALVQATMGSSTAALAMTESDGAFRLRRSKSPTDAVTLTVRHVQFEFTQTPQPIPWGTQDVVLVLRRGPALTVRVFDEAGQPLRRHAIRVLPRGTQPPSPLDAGVRARGPFAEDFATVYGVGAGTWTVVAEFPTDDRRTTTYTPIEVDGRDGMHVEIRAPRNVSRIVRVVSATGAPIVGTVVQLCLPYGAEFTDTTRVETAAAMFSGASGTEALLLAEAKTDAGGRAVLDGPPGPLLGIRVLGPGNVPERAFPVRWDEPGELRVTVRVGARLAGRLGPPDLLVHLRRLGGDANRLVASIGLVRGSGRDAESLPDDSSAQRFAIGPDGTFAVDELPSGDWEVVVRYRVQGSASTSFDKPFVVGRVLLREGDATRCDPDLTALLPGTLTGLVLQNGLPARNVSVLLDGDVGGADGTRTKDTATAGTDELGRFTVQLPAGVWRARLVVKGPDRLWYAPCVDPAIVVARQITTQNLTAATSALTVTLRDSSGIVAADVELEVRSVDSDQLLGVRRTGADGVTTSEVPAGTIRFRVLPRRLQSHAAQQQLLRDTMARGVSVNEALEPHWLDLGTTTAASGTPTAIELRLPPEYEK